MCGRLCGMVHEVALRSPLEVCAYWLTPACRYGRGPSVPQPEIRSLLVEAFPAAQLSSWGLPQNSYNGSGADARSVRQKIIESMQMRKGLVFRRAEDALAVLDSADALDSVICAFAGKAVAEFRLHSEPSDAARLEGWIARYNVSGESQLIP
jgi:hypothetical protein